MGGQGPLRVLTQDIVSADIGGVSQIWWRVWDASDKQPSARLLRNGWGGAVKYRLDGEAGLDPRHAGNPREHVEHEPLVARQIRDNDTQNVVGFARHEVAAHDLGHVGDSPFENLEGFLDLSFERNPDVHRDPEAEFLF